MRPDLAKLTTEKPRAGGEMAKAFKRSLGNVKVVNDDDHEYDNEFGGFHSSARRRHKEYKELTDKLSPIKGVLRKNCGRPWDKVYSELSQVLDRRSVAGIHIFSHVLDYVDRNTYMKDGQVFARSRWGTECPVEPSFSVSFYVHPITGLLLQAKRKSRYTISKVDNPDLILLEDGNAFEKIDGVWYHGYNLTFDEWSRVERTSNHFVAKAKWKGLTWYLDKKGLKLWEVNNHSFFKSYNTSGWKRALVDKRTCSHKEIRSFLSKVSGK